MGDASIKPTSHLNDLAKCKHGIIRYRSLSQPLSEETLLSFEICQYGFNYGFILDFIMWGSVSLGLIMHRSNTWNTW